MCSSLMSSASSRSGSETHFQRTASTYGRVPVPELLIARLATETRSIRLGTGVKILPLDTPLHFAEEVSLLDLLTDGRAEFGVGQGSGLNITFTGIDDAGKHLLYRSKFDELLKYLAGDVEGGRQPLSPPPTRDLSRLLWVASRDPELESPLPPSAVLTSWSGRPSHRLCRPSTWRATGASGAAE